MPQPTATRWRLLHKQHHAASSQISPRYAGLLSSLRSQTELWRGLAAADGLMNAELPLADVAEFQHPITRLCLVRSLQPHKLVRCA